jgi:C4-dicarboxylate-specific signal transduction histidine kinase
VGWLLRRIIPSLDRELQASGVELRVPDPRLRERSADGGPIVRADAPERVREVLVALVSNARTAVQGAPPPRWIRIALESRADGGAEIRVSDSGPGVPEGAEERIFLPFVSGWGGHGMGLSRSRRFLADAGGGLRLNRLAGGHCEFVLTLEPFIQESP